jgi:3-mercaptopyruvate sulfurtransferase SseA
MEWRKEVTMKMRTWLTVTALLFAMALGASTLRAQDNVQDDTGPVDPALAAAEAAPVQTISPSDVLKLMHDKSASFALVDTQPADGYVDGHIPGAISYPWVMQIKNFPISLPRDRMLVFYGSCPNDTSDMIKKLAEFGYMNVRVMDGGWYKWLDLHYPVAGKRSEAAPAELSQLVAVPASRH